LHFAAHTQDNLSQCHFICLRGRGEEIVIYQFMVRKLLVLTSGSNVA
jgi:hypothetical protein